MEYKIFPLSLLVLIKSNKKNRHFGLIHQLGLVTPTCESIHKLVCCYVAAIRLDSGKSAGNFCASTYSAYMNMLNILVRRKKKFAIESKVWEKVGLPTNSYMCCFTLLEHSLDSVTGYTCSSTKQQSSNSLTAFFPERQYTLVRGWSTSMFCLSVPTHCKALSHWMC